MRRGRYRHRVDILAPVRGVGSTGAPTITHYTPWQQRWADIVPLSGTEQETAGRVEARYDYRITIRFLEGLTAAHVVRLRDGTWLGIVRMRSVLQREIDHELGCVAIADGTVGP